MAIHKLGIVYLKYELKTKAKHFMSFKTMAISTQLDSFFCSLTKTHLPESPRTKIVSLNSGKIRMGVFGSGTQTVVLCPDPPNLIEHYASIIDLVSKELRVVIFEPAGFGYSKPSSSFRFDLASGVKMIREVMDASATEKAILCFPCVSGLHALQFSIQYPERVVGLVTMQTPNWDDLKDWVKRMDTTGMMKVPFVGQAAVRVARRKVQPMWYKIAEPDKEKRQQYNQLLHKASPSGCHFCLASAFQQIKGDDPFSGKHLDKPSTILWGMKDKTYRNTQPDSMAKYLKDPQMVKVDHAGHFPEMTAPNELFSALQWVAQK